jgi:transposase
MLCLLSPEEAVPVRHPIRQIKKLTDECLAKMASTFEEMYSVTGRPSIPPEHLLKASLLMALYSVRSERQFCEQLGYNLLFRWFLDMDMVEPTFDATSFTKNRERLLKHAVAEEFFSAVVEQARRAHLMSSEHFTVDGTLIDANASLKSFKEKGRDDDDPPDDPGNPTVNFRGEVRTNDTHESSTDPEAKLFRKGNGREARLSFMAHAMMENRNGLLVDLRVTEANGRVERATALEMLCEHKRESSVTVAADKAYDTKDFVAACRAMNVVPQVAQMLTRNGGSAIDGRTVRHIGYWLGQRVRKRVEEIFGWAKTVGGFRRTRFRGKKRTQLAAYLVGAAYNLVRLSRLLAEPA